MTWTAQALLALALGSAFSAVLLAMYALALYKFHDVLRVTYADLS